MKENILYAYHLEIENIEEQKNYSVFQWKGNIYYFTKVKRNEKEFQELLNVMDELFKKRVPIFPFVRNVSGTFLTNVNDTPYVLVEVTNPTIQYGLLEIMEFQKQLILNNEKSSLYRNEWANLWSSKVDYFEYQVSLLGKDHPVILNSFSYYIGLAENAISYAKFVEKNIPKPKDLPIVLSHRRVVYPNLRLNFDNPLNFIFDIEVRDIASYIKSMFFQNKEDAMIDLKAYIDLRKPDFYSLSMLYARLLYPSYYFDLHEKIIEENESDDILLPLIDQINDYENFLKDVWLYMNCFFPLEPIPWIIKKEL